MTTAIKRRRGTTTQHSSFTGLEGELTVDTTKDTVVVHDGSTAGGFPLLREDLNNNTNVLTTSNSKTLTNKTINLTDNTLSGTLAQFNTAVSDADLVSIAGSETLTNKTLTSPNINTATISGGTINNAVIGGSQAAAATVTNLTASGTVNFNGATISNLGTITTADINGGTIDGTSIGSSSASTGAFTTLSASSTVSGTGFSTYLASPPAIGGTTAAAGKFTTLEATGVTTVSAGTVSAPAITTTGDTNTGIFFPAADTIAFAEGGAEAMRIDSSGNVGIGATATQFGTAYKTVEIAGTDGGAIRLRGSSDTVASQDAAIYKVVGSTGALWLRNYANGPIGFMTNNTERARIDESGNLLVGTTTSNGFKFKVSDGGAAEFAFFPNDTGVNSLVSYNRSTVAYFPFQINSLDTRFLTGGGTERMRIDSSGNVGIGTSSPAAKLDVRGDLVLYQNANSAIVSRLANDSTGAAADSQFYVQNSANTLFFGLPSTGFSTSGLKVANTAYLYFDGANGINIGATNASGPLKFYTGGTSERMRINSSGNVGIGTSSPSELLHLVSSTADKPVLLLENTTSNNTTTGNAPILRFFSNDSDSSGIPDNAELGIVEFRGDDKDGGTNRNYAQIKGLAADPGGTYKGAITFSTASGAVPAERARITSGGDFLVGTTNSSPAVNNVAGASLRSIGIAEVSADGNPALFVNRKTSDGGLVSFRQDGTEEGTISVSGTTVSYNGGHLSRWAQTQGPKDNTLVKGTVLSNLDEMNVYTDAEGNSVDNEQLNKVKVSDVDGDVNVAGVFVNWSYDEQHQVDEINMAMTGDMIIRIAQGVVVQKGDLLMSAGDGTAKPQGDDIVRSKTVAKVTSNHVTCTYADGSYCVPCVLMAC